ncbi:hypothetical protein R6Q59_032832 [Mikania micrantha]|uniref:Uncharacterized protein n=1 Tax=Mikania micrantha TaxID=192012 RepID=A0A5N6NUV4_9ASTR|nr:hypothetical protein E3N88_17423 [Mikania micrantha]
MDTTESEYVMVEIPGNQRVNNNNVSLISEWEDCLRGKEGSEHPQHQRQRQRQMQKVPPSLLKTKKGRANSDYYKPSVVSLGPYHHNQTRLSQAEKYKLITLEEYSLSTGKTVRFLYDKVFEVVPDARRCYIDGSTDAYNDEELNRMMLHDGCFILFMIESTGNNKSHLVFEYLGSVELSNIMCDLFLLENQIPFVVLQVLLELKFPADKGEDVLNKFFNFLKYGELVIRGPKVLENRQPLHLLELYRSCFISASTSLGRSGKFRRWIEENEYDEDFYNYVKRNRWFASATELKAKWIFLNESKKEDMKFIFHRFYGEFKLARRAVATHTKAIYLNMIAYEMCPHNPNDFRVSTYLLVMKALVIRDKDVKELRHKHILVHGLGRDKEVASMFDEIEVLAVNFYMYNLLRGGIERLHENKYKTWVAELVSEYFSSPWKTMGLLVATAILLTSFLQTYFAIHPRNR